MMKINIIMQVELVSKIGVTESSVSRSLKWTKDKLTTEQGISIALNFNVSSDFLLCLTNVPGKKTTTFPNLVFPPKQHEISIPEE